MSTDKNKKFLIASDHNGNAARAHIIKVFGEQAIDLGPYGYDGKVDYIDYAISLCELILDESYPCSKGILICGTGTGMSIVANRFPGIRAALVTDVATAYLSREHNDSNVLVLGQWRTPLGSMDEIVRTWLESECTEVRHRRRLKKLEDLKI